jgi:hypothetical protein
VELHPERLSLRCSCQCRWAGTPHFPESQRYPSLDSEILLNKF